MDDRFYINNIRKEYLTKQDLRGYNFDKLCDDFRQLIVSHYPVGSWSLTDLEVSRYLYNQTITKGQIELVCYKLNDKFFGVRFKVLIGGIRGGIGGIKAEWGVEI